MKPKSVKIGGTELRGILDVDFEIAAPTDERGNFTGTTQAATVTIKREALIEPHIDIFKAATNEDGRLKYIEVDFVFENQKRLETYNVTLKKAFITNWTMTDEFADNAVTYEEFTLKCGDLKFSASDGSSEYKMARWDEGML